MSESLHPARRSRRLPSGAGIILPLVMFGLVVRSLPALAAETTFRSIPGDFMGIHVHDWLAPGHMPSRVPLWRAWDARVTWPDLEPAKGVWQPARLEALVRAARSRGTRLILPLALTPTWASGMPATPNAYGLGRGGPVADVEAWGRYVARIAEVARHEGADLELWNEPDLPDFSRISPEEMASLARRTRQVLDRVWPQGRLVGPAVTLRHGLPWLARYLAAGGASPLSALTVHAYVTPDGPEALWPALDALRAVLRRTGADTLPLWCTEIGWRIEASGRTVLPQAGTSFARVLSEREAVDYLRKSVFTLAASGFSRVCWYAWDNRDMGLASVKSGSPKAAGDAWLQLAAWLPGKRIGVARGPSGLSWQFLVRETRGGTRAFVWTAGQEMPGFDPLPGVP